MLMFTRVGLFLPALFRHLKSRSTVLLTFALSAGIEVSQYAFALGRFASVQDLALDVIGGIGAAALGVYLVRPWTNGRDATTPGSQEPRQSASDMYRSEYAISWNIGGACKPAE